MQISIFFVCNANALYIARAHIHKTLCRSSYLIQLRFNSSREVWPVHLHQIKCMQMGSIKLQQIRWMGKQWHVDGREERRKKTQQLKPHMFYQSANGHRAGEYASIGVHGPLLGLETDTTHTHTHQMRSKQEKKKTGAHTKPDFYLANQKKKPKNYKSIWPRRWHIKMHCV